MLTENYELTSDTEIDMIITDLPLDLIKENIRAQIADPLYTRVNYIESIEDKIDMLIETYGEIPDMMDKVNNLIIDIYSFIISNVCERFEIGYDIDFSQPENVREIAKAMYHYLVVRYKKNIFKYIMNYIGLHKKELGVRYNDKRKDVTTIAVKRKVKNKEEASIIANLPDIVSEVLNLDTSVEDFFSMTSGSSNYESSYLNDLFNTFTLNGDFVNTYFNIVINEYEDVLGSITNDINFKLLSK